MSILKIGLVVCLGALAESTFAQEVPKLLPFQGRLTDAQGSPVADGPKLILFEIYDVPTGGNAAWPGEMHKTTVNGGLVNVLLGSKSPFGATSPDFNKTLYLQITIDSNGDNAITSADPPLLPRQVILPAVFAKEAADSRKLAGYPVDQLPSNIPVGGVIMWWGNRNGIPAGFELCDGSAPTTAGALLQGVKPDLRDRFVKGATSTASDVKSVPITGGTSTFPSGFTGDTTLTVAQIPSHTHGVTDPGHSHGVADPGHRHPSIFNASGGGDSFTIGGAQRTSNNSAFAYGGVNTTGISINAGATGISLQTAGGSQPHNHAIPTENRPAFLELFFIIRVR